MREAFGGSWLLGFVALFIVLFSAYLAVSINYTKAFKAKNKIINIIEQNEGMSKSVGDVRNKTDEELNKGKTTEFGQMRHSKSIKFHHPRTKKELYFEVEPPQEFKEKLQEQGLSNSEIADIMREEFRGR